MLRSALLALAWASSAGQAPDVVSSPTEAGPPARRAPADLAGRIWAITDAVLDHHLDPPARQQMILGGLEAVCRASKVERPVSLARRVSAITSVEALAPLLDEIWSLAPSDRVTLKSGKSESEAPLEDFLVDGLLGRVAGGPNLLSAKELKAEEQISANSYVGLHIAAGYDQESKRPQIMEVFKGGPGDRAGLRAKDLIEEVDGVSTEGMTLRAVIERLRGDLGTSVVLRIRQPKSEESRTITATRGILPRQTLQGIRKFPGGGGEVLVRGPGQIAYLKFEEITGSTRQELRGLARQIEADGARAVVLDLRPVGQAGLHPTILLADSLLEGGTIGRLRSAPRVETFQAEPDACFRGLPLAVLVDERSPGPVLWLAAALQDNHRATIVAGPSHGPRPIGSPRMARLGRGGPIEMVADDTAVVHTAVPIGDGTWSLRLMTGRLERGDGRPITGPRPRLPNRPQFVRPDDENEDNDRAGGRLEPDIRVDTSATTRGQPVPSGDTPEVDPNVRGDAVLTAALRHLRGVLKPSSAE